MSSSSFTPSSRSTGQSSPRSHSKASYSTLRRPIGRQQIDWSHYQFVLRNNDFIRALQNSVVVSVGSVAISLLFGSFAAYALGRMQFRGRTAVLYIVLSMTMFPSVAILGSLFLMIRGDWLLPTPNLYNTRIALVITYLTFTLPFTVWVMTQFFKAMPGELEEAALVDGAGPMRVFWQILLPLGAAWTRHDRFARLHRRLERVPLRLDLHHDSTRAQSSRRSPVLRQHAVRTAVRATAWRPRCSSRCRSSRWSSSSSARSWRV